jgi:hypothetical protein
MSVLGHESIAAAQVYTKAYDRARAADDALAKLAEVKPTNVTGLRRPKG